MIQQSLYTLNIISIYDMEERQVEVKRYEKYGRKVG
jgi:hypothetical protein